MAQQANVLSEPQRTARPDSLMTYEATTDWVQARVEAWVSQLVGLIVGML